MLNILVTFFLLIHSIFGLNIKYVVDHSVKQLDNVEPILYKATQILSSYNIKPLGDNSDPEIDLEVKVEYSQSKSGFVAWATPDFTSRNKLGRPLKGTIIFFDTPAFLQLEVHTAYLVVHELLHIMAFEKTLLNSFTTISDNLLHTPTILQKAKENFNCSTLPGVLLNTPHLDQAPFMEDIMVPEFRSRHANITPITLAVLKDTGWWDVDINMASHSKWGHNWGCDFASTACYKVRNYSFPFCVPKTYNCTYDKIAYGYCLDSNCPTILQTRHCEICDEKGCRFFEDMKPNSNSAKAAKAVKGYTPIPILFLLPMYFAYQKYLNKEDLDMNWHL